MVLSRIRYVGKASHFPISFAFAVDVHEKKTHLSFEIEDFVETQLCQLRVVLAILAILPSRMLQLVHDLVKGTVRWLCLVSNMAITELVFR